jgi:hypothetical protein
MVSRVSAAAEVDGRGHLELADDERALPRGARVLHLLRQPHARLVMLGILDIADQSTTVNESIDGLGLVLNQNCDVLIISLPARGQRRRSRVPAPARARW